jgi:hypothetical protein
LIKKPTLTVAFRVDFLIILCRRRESNPHSFRNTILSRARLPIPPLRLAGEANYT